MTCQKCNMSLVFHRSAEQAARLYDACMGNKNTTCWLCERKVKGDAEAPVPRAARQISTGNGAGSQTTAEPVTPPSQATEPVSTDSPNHKNKKSDAGKKRKAEGKGKVEGGK